ncbi:cupin domain-containing protein [Streptomyces phaeochromogenes]
MELLKQPPTMRLPAEWFTGDAYADVIYRGEAPSRMRANMVRFTPGDVVHTPPGEEHWHGAAADQFMIHLALWETDDATWLKHVSDDEYHGPRVSTRTRP